MPKPGGEVDAALEHALGYLNFSSGASDPQFLASLDLIFAQAPPGEGKNAPPHRFALEMLSDRLAALAGTTAAFAKVDQAAAVLKLLSESILPGYITFHRDLLFHQNEESLFSAFFVGRAFEALLAQGPPWDDAEQITQRTIARLNDFIGYRPVATLEQGPVEPYPREWVRPIPLYIRGAGTARGPHYDVVQMAIKLLEETDKDLLRAAYFDAGRLDELAVDPRAYDFDHPANKRPNYHFGQWDPHQIDGRGFYRRFVVQQVTLDALMDRVENPEDLPAEEVLFEAASVLAGTMLMASGISGAGPDSHDSSVTLANLLPRIASYRDEFYERLFARMSGGHAQRLRREAKERRQPFGGARQHLNAQLAQRRASQLEHVHLARAFARMGYAETASTQADVVPCASARILCRVDCLLAEGALRMGRGEYQQAAGMLPSIVDLLNRGIDCGAIVDPWNILGFDAQFSLFPAIENSIRDHRVDELVAIIEQLFAFYSLAWSEAAAVDDNAMCRQISVQFQETARWWRQFAVHEVSSVGCEDPQETYRAAERVAEALNLWHRGGAASGDVAFWAPHAEMFDSPKAYALVIDALLKRNDLIASMALLTHWLCQADRMPLELGEASFYQLTTRWLLEAQREEGEDVRRLARKFIDFLEANAGDLYYAPTFQLGTAGRSDGGLDALFAGPEDDEEQDLFGAAYEDVVYRDSTDDGMESSVFDSGRISEDEMEAESQRIGDRLALLDTFAALWRLAALSGVADSNHADTARQWAAQAQRNRHDLRRLLDSVSQYRIPTPSGDHDSLVEYDRRRLFKESLLERIIVSCVEMADAGRMLLAAAGNSPGDLPRDLETEQQRAVPVYAALLARQADDVRRHFPPVVEALGEEPLLYVPLAKGGDAHKIVAARGRQRMIQDLLAWLPRLGLLTETCRLIDTAREMERDHPVGAGAVTEFDELFQIGYKALVESLAVSAETWAERRRSRRKKGADGDDGEGDEALVECLEQMTEALLAGWLNHSRTLRLSVLEKVKDKRSWKSLVAFIEKYGGELFTQRFFSLGNIRGILHQGVDAWLRQLEEDPNPEYPRLVEDLDQALPRQAAVEHLSLVLEAIIENYGEYRDYNSTTTQSDRGDLLYMLLDFLRLRTGYDRIAWNLKPVVWAHDILVRRGRHAAAARWRRSLAERISDEADRYLERLAELQKKYAMRMPTVADRMEERFMHPLTIDRVCALVAPAIREAKEGGPHHSFDLLILETQDLTRRPSGVGLDPPNWLVALLEEVDEVRRLEHGQAPDDFGGLIQPLPLSLEETQRQLNEWTERSS